VAKTKEEPLKIVVLHDGDEKQLEVAPVKRPEGLGLPVITVGDGDLNVVRQWLNRDVTNLVDLKGISILRLAPGAVVDEDVTKVLKSYHKQVSKGEEGKSISIVISKENDGAANITVTEDGETSNATEDSLDQLSKEIQEKVLAILQRKPANLGAVIQRAIPGGQIRLRAAPQKRAPLSAVIAYRLPPASPVRKPAIRKHVNQVEGQNDLAEQFKSFQKQLDAISKELKELREEK
jgi:hypothetical protein